MNTIVKGAVGFVVAYLALMVPTYILPYFGSNSAIAGAIGAAIGHRTTPQFWMHVWCLVLLVLVTSIRGRNIGKNWLLIYPVLAGVFDLVPGLNVIPLVPTVMHLFALLLGAKGTATASAKVDDVDIGNPWDANPHPRNRYGWETWAAGLMSVLAVAGATSFLNAGRLTNTQPVTFTKTTADVKVNDAMDADLAKPINHGRPVGAESKSFNATPLSGTLVADPIQSSLPQPEVKKALNRPRLKRAVEPKNIEGKPTVRYIKIDQ